MNLKKILAAFMAAAMVLGTMVMPAFADDGGIGGSSSITTALNFTTATADESGNGYTWNNTNKTLTLDGLNLSVTDESAITVPNGTTIVLEADSENSIKTNHAKGYGISANGSLTIKTEEGKSGTLDIVATNYGIRYSKNEAITEAKFDFSNIILNIAAVRGVVMNTDAPISNTALTMTGVTCKFTQNGVGSIRPFQVWPTAGDATLTIKDSVITGEGQILLDGGNNKLIVDNSTVSVSGDIYVQRGTADTMEVNNSTVTAEKDILVGGCSGLAELKVINSTLITGSKYSGNAENVSLEIGNGSASEVKVTIKGSKITCINGEAGDFSVKPKEDGTKDVEISDSIFFLAGNRNSGAYEPVDIPEGNDATIVHHSGAALTTDANGNKKLALADGATISSNGKTYVVVGNADVTMEPAEGDLFIPAGTTLKKEDGITIASEGVLTFEVGSDIKMPADAATIITTNGVEVKLTPTVDALLVIDNDGNLIIPAGTTVEIGDEEAVVYDEEGYIELKDLVPCLTTEADSGYYAETKDSEDKSGEIAFRTMFENYADYDISNYGLFIWKGNRDGGIDFENATLNDGDATKLTTAEGYFTGYVTDIPTDAFDETISARAFAQIGDKKYYGEAVSTTVNTNAKWLGAKEAE